LWVVFSELPGMIWLPIPLVEAGFGAKVWWVTVRVVGWSLVENCTVDASIFVFCG
jgi:hypothetical protein